jgi:hypothetical protein
MTIRLGNKILGAPPNMHKIYDLTGSVGHSTVAADNRHDDVLLVQYFLNKIYRGITIHPVTRLAMDGVFGPITHYWMLHFMAGVRSNEVYLHIPGNYTFSPLTKAVELIGGESIHGGDATGRAGTIAKEAVDRDAPTAAWDMFLQTWIGQLNFMAYEADPMNFNELTTKDPLMPAYLKRALDGKVHA